MTTARTHRRNVGRGGAARPRVASPTPDDFTAISAETFAVVEASQDGGVDSPADPSVLDFDPADHNVDDVKAFVEANPEYADAIFELELNGKERSTVLSFLESFGED